MTSEPPPASSWAAPPEFYLDENSVTRMVRRLLTSLGYRVHDRDVGGSRHRRDAPGADGWGCWRLRRDRAACAGSLGYGGRNSVLRWSSSVRTTCVPCEHGCPLQIRNVPGEARRVLKARAAARGESLNAYLLEMINREVSRPTVAEVLQRAERASASAVGVLTAARAERDFQLRRLYDE